MQLREFINRRADHIRRSKRFDTIYMVAFFTILVSNVFVAGIIPDTWLIYYVVGFFAFLFANVLFAIWFSRRRNASSGLVCKSCKGSLLGMPGDLAVTTGKCSHCGGDAFHT